jgi:transposase
MFSITAARYFLFLEATDMRKSFDSLCGFVGSRLGMDSRSGDIFIFINKPRNRVKMLRWEEGGFVLFYKRLEKGTFELPDASATGPSHKLGYGELAMLITGISVKNAKKRQRF